MEVITLTQAIEQLEKATNFLILEYTKAKANFINTSALKEEKEILEEKINGLTIKLEELTGSNQYLRVETEWLVSKAEKVEAVYSAHKSSLLSSLSLLESPANLIEKMQNLITETEKITERTDRGLIAQIVKEAKGLILNTERIKKEYLGLIQPLSQNILFLNPSEYLNLHFPEVSRLKQMQSLFYNYLIKEERVQEAINGIEEKKEELIQDANYLKNIARYYRENASMLERVVRKEEKILNLQSELELEKAFYFREKEATSTKKNEVKRFIDDVTDKVASDPLLAAPPETQTTYEKLKYYISICTWIIKEAQKIEKYLMEGRRSKPIFEQFNFKNFDEVGEEALEKLIEAAFPHYPQIENQQEKIEQKISNLNKQFKAIAFEKEEAEEAIKALENRLSQEKVLNFSEDIDYGILQKALNVFKKIRDDCISMATDAEELEKIEVKITSLQ